jgi:hypothetical protein
MKTQEFVTGSTVRGPFLASQPGSCEHEFQSTGFYDESGDVPTAEIVLGREEKAAIKARFAPPRVTLTLMQTLLMTLCSRRPCRNRPADRDSTLPRGCIFAVRYSSQ